MIEITMTDLLLLIWAVGASATAGHYYGIAKHREKLLMGASMFTKKLVEGAEGAEIASRLVQFQAPSSTAVCCVMSRPIAAYSAWRS